MILSLKYKVSVLLKFEPAEAKSDESWYEYLSGGFIMLPDHQIDGGFQATLSDPHY